MLSERTDEQMMKQALIEAQNAFAKKEVPVGAVIVCKGRIIARAHNLTETLNDVTAHAEMQAFTSAAEYLGGKYLKDCTLYVTLEPCVMCAGAAFWTQIPRIVFGAYDKKRGYSQIKGLNLHPKSVAKGGVLKNECSAILQKFFEERREE